MSLHAESDDQELDHLDSDRITGGSAAGNLDEDDDIHEPLTDGEDNVDNDSDDGVGSLGGDYLDLAADGQDGVFFSRSTRVTR